MTKGISIALALMFSVGIASQAWSMAAIHFQNKITSPATFLQEVTINGKGVNTYQSGNKLLFSNNKVMTLKSGENPVFFARDGVVVRQGYSNFRFVPYSAAKTNEALASKFGNIKAPNVKNNLKLSAPLQPGSFR